MKLPGRVFEQLAPEMLDKLKRSLYSNVQQEI